FPHLIEVNLSSCDDGAHAFPALLAPAGFTEGFGAGHDPSGSVYGRIEGFLGGGGVDAFYDDRGVSHIGSDEAFLAGKCGGAPLADDPIFLAEMFFLPSKIVVV